MCSFTFSSNLKITQQVLVMQALVFNLFSLVFASKSQEILDLDEPFSK